MIIVKGLQIRVCFKGAICLRGRCVIVVVVAMCDWRGLPWTEWAFHLPDDPPVNLARGGKRF